MKKIENIIALNTSTLSIMRSEDFNILDKFKEYISKCESVSDSDKYLLEKCYDVISNVYDEMKTPIFIKDGVKFYKDDMVRLFEGGNIYSGILKCYKESLEYTYGILSIDGGIKKISIDDNIINTTRQPILHIKSVDYYIGEIVRCNDLLYKGQPIEGAIDIDKNYNIFINCKHKNESVIYHLPSSQYCINIEKIEDRDKENGDYVIKKNLTLEGGM